MEGDRKILLLCLTLVVAILSSVGASALFVLGELEIGNPGGFTSPGKFFKIFVKSKSLSASLVCEYKLYRNVSYCLYWREDDAHGSVTNILFVENINETNAFDHQVANSSCKSVELFIANVVNSSIYTCVANTSEGMEYRTITLCATDFSYPIAGANFNDSVDNGRLHICKNPFVVEDSFPSAIVIYSYASVVLLLFSMFMSYLFGYIKYYT